MSPLFVLGLKNECEVELSVHRHTQHLLKCLTLNSIVVCICIVRVYVWDGGCWLLDCICLCFLVTLFFKLPVNFLVP